MSGADIMMNLFDLTPDGGGRGAAADLAALTGEPVPEQQFDPRDDHIPTDLELVQHAVRSRVRKATGLLPLLRTTVESVNNVIQGRRDPTKGVGAVPLTAPTRVITTEHAAEMRRMLAAVVERGTGRAAAVPGQRVGGKTGTTQDSRDAWFVGMSSRWVIGIWLGNDNATPMDDVSGGSLPARLFREILEEMAR